MTAGAVMAGGAMASAAPVPLLAVEHLSMRFGGLVAVDDVSFTAHDRQITAIIGPNGAGKTTVFNCLTGFYKPSVGRLALRHPKGEMLLERMEGFRIGQHARVARTFQNIRLFGGMSVLENLMVAQHNKLMRASGFTVLGLVGAKSYRRIENEAKDRAVDWLKRVNLIRAADSPAGSLPYGDQRRLEIARALATDPQLLLLDEPAAGMNPAEKQALQQLIRKIRDSGRTVLLIEHDIDAVIPAPSEGLTGYRETVARALRNGPLPSDPNWAHVGRD